MPWSTQWITDAVGATLHGDPNVSVSSVVTDSREVTPGALYVARVGENTDGHNYITSACEKGAAALLVQRHQPNISLPQIVVEESTIALGIFAQQHIAHLRAQGHLSVIAVTGSAGKTTTKDLMAQLFSSAGSTVAPRLSYNNEVGVPLTALQATDATRYLILEMGASGPGHLRYLTDLIAPDLAIELMVGHAHMGGFGSVEGVAQAKAELIQGLTPHGRALLNADDAHVVAMETYACGRSTFFSANGDPQARFRATDITINESQQASFTLTDTLTHENTPVSLQLVGAHHVHNALAAASAAIMMGIPQSDVAQVLSASTAQSPHRMALHELIIAHHPVTLIDDSYNANSDSMQAALHTLSSLAQGRRSIAILGEMLELGQSSQESHEDVGRWAVQAGVEHIIAIGKQGLHYLRSAGSGVNQYHVMSYREAYDIALTLIDGSSIILVKGSNGSGAWRVADALIERGQSE